MSLGQAIASARRLATPRRVFRAGLAVTAILIATCVFTDLEDSFIDHTHRCAVTFNHYLVLGHSHDAPDDISIGSQLLDGWAEGEAIPHVPTDLACLDHAFPQWRDTLGDVATP